MRFGFNKTRLLPTGKLQVVIRSDATIGIVQRHLQVEPFKFSLEEVRLVAAFSNGEIKDLKRGLSSYLKNAGLNDFQRAYCEKLASRLFRLNRVASLSVDSTSELESDASFKGQLGDLPEGKLYLKTPCAFQPQNGLFHAVTHDGAVLPAITAEELHALSQLVHHHDLDSALAAHRNVAADSAIDKQRFAEVVKLFVAARFVDAKKDSDKMSSLEFNARIMSGEVDEKTYEVFRAHALAQDEAEKEHEKTTGVRRPRVIPVAFDHTVPAGLGAIIANSKVYEDGALDEFYNFRTDWIWDHERLEHYTREPAIYLFSNYLWSHKECIEVSAKIKQLSPGSITIHGGPDTPKYEGDELRYFESNPHIDVTVRGEGEETCAAVLSALRQVIGDDKPDLEVLRGVEGATFRSAKGEVVRNPDRPRVKDLNELPSAYLTGLFDPYIGLEGLCIIMETNRGCPYGCTFCDWGSATASKIRKFDEDRVMAEIAWASQARIESVSIADANFGIFPRDVDFAREAARLKRETGYPRGFGGNYAKNTVKYLRNIIDVLAEGDILSMGTLSLQTMDEETLDAINRSNIKTEKYDALAVEMRNANLPLTIELMMGLPGSSVDSFREDLQQCVDRELPVRVNMTTLLVNSPMNHPDYLQKYDIKTHIPLEPGNLATIASTSTYTEADRTYMTHLRETYMLFENYGVLRLVSRFVYQETGTNEVDFYEKLMADSGNECDWPVLYLLWNAVPSLMGPPASWAIVMEELGRYLESEFGISDSPARRAILAAQHACLPSVDRVYPDNVALECDVMSWFDAMLVEKEQGNRRDWRDAVPRLESYGPATLVVDDPHGVSETALGINREINMFGVNWELESPLHRARADLM